MTALKNVFAQVVTFRLASNVNCCDNYCNRDSLPAIIAIHNIRKKPYRTSLIQHNYKKKLYNTLI